MNYRKPLLGFLDLDGVIGDYHRKAIDALNLPVSHDEVTTWETLYEAAGLEPAAFYGEVAKHGSDFWEHMYLFPWRRDLISLVAQYTTDWWFVTQPTHCPESHSGKKRFIDRIYPGAKYALMADKWLLADKNRVLIDDKEENCDRFADRGGHAILFPQPWNRNRVYEKSRLHFVETQLQLAATKW